MHYETMTMVDHVKRAEHACNQQNRDYPAGFEIVGHAHDWVDATIDALRILQGSQPYDVWHNVDTALIVSQALFSRDYDERRFEQPVCEPDCDAVSCGMQYCVFVQLTAVSPADEA